MIRFLCPNCQSRLDAKDEIAGQTRKCPKCGQAVVVPPAAPSTPPAPDAPQAVAPPAEAPIPHLPVPQRLVQGHRYLICDRTRVIAAWEGEGWLLRTDFGFASAARNTDKLPNQGDFKLVDLAISLAHEKPLLKGLFVHQLAQRYALTKIPRGDDAVLQAVTGPAGLNREQKVAVRKYLGDRMMREIWGDNQAVLDYLGNYDFHSPGAAAAAP